MKKVIAILIALVLFGCVDEADDRGSVYSKDIAFDKICIDGFEYLWTQRGYAGYMSVHVKTDDSIYKCQGN